MRLIDADELKKELYQQWFMDILLTQRNSEDMFFALAQKIDEQPTAYNVDKVVEQLREQQEKLETDIFARESDNWYGQYCNGIHEGIDKAIEIVKAGGVNDNSKM
ncbi:hypothetical protein H8R94_02905 [Roseburia sp. NSJ-9]|uniref:Uncharacterized protein n=1 Tax=Roseburia lenta TaxID=2763061 RepID=A0ABR7GDR2_9FIRM|nr:hypothetical protein [Roseburia lenta]MBC5685573.1 hypothetical protein [Roseburia lenta]